MITLRTKKIAMRISVSIEKRRLKVRYKEVKLPKRREVREIATIIITTTIIEEEEVVVVVVAEAIVSISYKIVLHYILLKGVRQLIDLLKS